MSQYTKMDPRMHPVGRSVACYFCNEFFKDKYLKDHVVQCGAVLEPCPKQCGVYIQRSGKEKHIMECKFKKPRPRSTHNFLETMPVHQNQSTPVIGGVQYLETELVTLRSSLTEEKRFRQELQIEVQRLQKLYQKSEEYNKHLNADLENIKRSCFEITEKKKSTDIQNQLEMDKVHLQYQVLNGWKKEIDASVEFVKNRLMQNETKLLDLEFTVKNYESRLGIIDRIEMDINMLHQKVNDEEFNRQEETISWRGELNEFKEFFAQENAMIGALWTEQRNEIENLKKAVELQINAMNDFKTKHHTLTFDTKSVKQTATEAAENLESQSKELKHAKDMLEQLKLDFSGLEQSISNTGSRSNHNGHLLWRLDDFKEKMEKAKSHNTVLHSPVFYSNEYGYKIRLEVFLNGIKKWRGRHVIISLQVLKGEWDPVLIWPCHIEAKIIVKEHSSSQGKGFSKYITAKRIAGDEENEEPQESSSQYIFITHTTLEKHNFIKDNTLFLEIKVINDKLGDKKTLEVTTL
ncbi:TNF-receptor-associated factor-like [Carabus blaptoides fortunei]